MSSLITSISSQWETGRAQSSQHKRDGRFGVWIGTVPYEKKKLIPYQLTLAAATVGDEIVTVKGAQLNGTDISQSIILHRDDAIAVAGATPEDHSLIILKKDTTLTPGVNGTPESIPAHVVYNDVLDGAITHTYALLPLRGHMQGLPTASPNNEQEGMNRNGSQFSSYDFNGIKVATQLSGEFLWNDPAASKLHSLLAAGGTIKLHFEFRGFPLEQAHDDSPTFGAGPACYRYLSKSVIGFEGGSTSDSMKLNINFNNDGEIQNYYPPGLSRNLMFPSVRAWLLEEYY